MAGATNWAALEQQIMAKMRSAMNSANTTIKADMDKETSSFYSQGNPRLYDRTGKLGKSPKTTPVSGSGKSLSFDAYLDTSYTYDMPNPKFMASWYTTTEVLVAAENSFSGILGKGGFWRNSKAKFQKDLDSAMSKYFTRA